MEVRILTAGCSRKLPSGATQSYPVGWTGEVPEDIALEWIATGQAEVIGGDVSLSARQKEFLAAFADAAMVAHNIDPNPHGEDESSDGDGGEQNADAEPETVDSLRALTVPELKARARAANIRGYSKMNEGELINALLGG